MWVKSKKEPVKETAGITETSSASENGHQRPTDCHNDQDLHECEINNAFKEMFMMKLRSSDVQDLAELLHEQQTP